MEQWSRQQTVSLLRGLERRSSQTLRATPIELIRSASHQPPRVLHGVMVDLVTRQDTLTVLHGLSPGWPHGPVLYGPAN